MVAEEAEPTLRAHEGVADVVVVGQATDRSGEEVVAVVQSVNRADLDVDELIATASERIARFKLPKVVVWAETIRRSPAGKADDVWARQLAAERTATINHHEGSTP